MQLQFATPASMEDADQLGMWNESEREAHRAIQDQAKGLQLGRVDKAAGESGLQASVIREDDRIPMPFHSRDCPDHQPSQAAPRKDRQGICPEKRARSADQGEPDLIAVRSKMDIHNAGIQRISGEDRIQRG